MGQTYPASARLAAPAADSAQQQAAPGKSPFSREGPAMLKFYFNGSPNPTKVALFLEEAEIPYEPIAIDTRKGDQFAPDFLAINPNGKVPAIVDGDVTMFDSNAILLYLAEKTGKFLPPASQRPQLLSWLMFAATGIGPYSGQA